MTSKEYIKEHLKSLRKDFDIAIKNNLKDYANKLVEEIKCSENILKDLEILEILKKRIKYDELGETQAGYMNVLYFEDGIFEDEDEDMKLVKEWLNDK